ncbi:PQQ-binding-like beta-propeller repeat protein [Actinoallomurus sp. CA-142502]|uniref:outer membrane protein assembly factor BamB family protein n=1 Tax=Actinoallomurus sp. CA-142502 TaxID=3239885 RepID=UPI003D941D9F
MAPHRRLLSALIPAQTAALMLGAAACGGSSDTPAAADRPAWNDTAVDAVSRPVIGSGFTASTALGRDGHLQTVVSDVRSGKRLWARPAVISGRPAAMGVAPPAIAGTAGHTVVASVETQGHGTALVGRDARTGAQRWTRAVGTTFGPARCGTLLCVSEQTARKSAAFTVLNPETGKPAWHMPGVAEVEWAGPGRVVVFRMSAHPTVEAHDLATGKEVWAFPVENALGRGADLSGGWAFGSVGDTLIGYLAPYQTRANGPLSAFGFFSLRLDDGKQQWVRKRLLRVYPSANPAVSLITREVDDHDRYGGFTELDPRTGRSVTRLTTSGTPKATWWLAFPDNLSAVGFLAHDQPSLMYDLRTGKAVGGHARAWSFCTTTPAPLKITGQQGFYPIAALCPYDLKSGHRLDAAQAVPPSWYTGAVDGWRVWRDERGGLHGVHDGDGTSPGMYQ